MHSQKWLMLLINIVGGAAVLGSYAWGLGTHPNGAEALWGGVPASIRPVYTGNMFLAAAGWFAFMHFLLLRLDADRARVAGWFGYGIFIALIAAILFPSALWMPLTFAAVGSSSNLLVWVVRLILAIVGLASLGLLVALLRVDPKQPSWAHALAVIGCAFFCLQTAVLDMIVWSATFSV